MKKVIENIGLKIVSFFLAGLFITPAAFAQNNNRNSAANDVKSYAENKILKDNDINQSNIKVEVINNSIFLTGTVPNLYERELAGKDAAEVSQGYSIQNNLKIAEASIPTNEVEKNVLNNIYRNGYYGIFDWVDVSDTNGVVTLTGWVHDPWLKKWFQKDAEKVDGVKQIKNEIKNTYGPGSIGYNAAWLVYNQPQYAGTRFRLNPPIHIIVKDYTIILKGKARTAGEGEFLKNLLEFKTDASTVIDKINIKS